MKILAGYGNEIIIPTRYFITNCNYEIN